LSLKEPEIESMGKGATNQTELSASDLGRLIINLPQIQTQKRIASILSSYDDLIENNLKRIKLLEETAQNIYKEWFVNFRFPNYENTPINQETGLPEGWEKDIIGNQLLTIKRNGKLKTDHYEKEGRFPIIDQGNGYIAGYTNNEEIVQNQQLPIVIFGDHTRRVKFVNFPFVSGADGTQLMYPKNEKMLPAYFYLSIKSIDLSNYAYARHFKFMKEQSILIPDIKTLNDFNSKVYPLLEQLIKLFSYNQKLKEARDILLPRLMNRTIEV
jgi:type I restriction enzyme S subunit